jgi:hypothetical protein
MIIENTVRIGLGRNIEYLKTKGYEIPYHIDKKGRPSTGKGSSIIIRVEDIPKKSNAMVTVSCEDCGRTREIHYYSLFQNTGGWFEKTGETPCCSCANKRNKGKANSRYKHGNNNYCFYRFNAKRRGYSFNLTVLQFETFTTANCFYCGQQGGGIDRTNNDVGYEHDNCVPCCKDCNFLKQGRSIKVFLQKIRVIEQNTRDYEI